MRKNILNNFLFILVIVCYLILIGFYREHLFVNVNFQSYKTYYPGTYDYELPPDMKWLERFSYTQLYYFKFPLTFLFTLLYFLPAYLTMRRFFPGKQNLQLTVFAYASLFLLALFIFGIGFFLGSYQKCYSIARYLMGFIQSPLLLMILIPVFIITKRENKSS